MASLFHWLLCSLCISNILLIVSNMLESLGALQVMWMRMNLDQLRRLALFCANEAQMIQKLQVELPGYLALLPIFFVSSHVFLSTTVLITVAITIERYQVEKIFFSTSFVVFSSHAPLSLRYIKSSMCHRLVIFKQTSLPLSPS